MGVCFAGLLGLLMWSRTLSPLALATAAAVIVGAAVLELRRLRRGGAHHRGARLVLPLSVAALLLGLAAAGATTIRLERGVSAWDEVVRDREQRLSARLEDRMRGVIRRASAAAYLAADPGAEPSFEMLEEIRDRTDVDAVALVGRDGAPAVWAGDHRGRLPQAVLDRQSGVVYPGGALFAYLYVVTPAGGDRKAVSAVLVQAGPPLRGRTEAAGERFQAVTGERPRFAPGADADADWTLQVEGEPVLNARFPDLSQAEWRARVARTGRQLVFGLVLLALGALSMGWLRSLRDRSGLPGMVPMGALSLTLMAAPLRRTLGLDRLFSPGFFVLPLPGDFVIEGVMVVLLPLAALVSTLRPPLARPRDLWLRLAIGAAFVGGLFALGVALMTGSAGLPMLTSDAPLWLVLQPTTVVLLAVPAALLIPRAARPDERRTLVLWGAVAVAVSIGLALGVAGSWRPDRPTPTPLLLAWSIPFALAARGVAGYVGRGDRLLRWLTAGWLAATAAIPQFWVASQAAQLEVVGREVETLGTRSDPYLAYLLGEFAEELVVAEQRGEQGVDLLYEAWVASDLAGEPYPLQLSSWDAALNRQAHLPLGVNLAVGTLAQTELLDVVRQAVVSDSVLNVATTGGGISRVLAVPLPGGRAVSVAVGPRASLRSASALTTFIEGDPRDGARLELLPASAAGAVSPGEVQWRKVEDGWRAETAVREGSDVYRAYLQLENAPAGVQLARAVLLITLNLLLLTALWGLGRLTRGDPPVPPGGWIGWLGGFRARLIATLLVFFLLPTAVFGWATYRALAGEVARAARQVAERAVVHAAALLPQESLVEAARRTGEDLLYYRDGALRGASVPEAVELGLYQAWIPPALYRPIQRGEAVGGVQLGELAGRSYLVAYRRLRSPDELVAVPVWLAARDVAVRQREFAHLVLFGILVGTVLSLGLAVRVGRTLAEPIGELRRAASVVGRGDLRVRLPEQRADEFGELFTSFNRMTRRLRRARAREVRTARILAWGEMARQVAHEIKNPLTPIKLAVQHIRRAHRDRRPDFGAILEGNVEQILQEIDRLTEIARAFSRYGAPQEQAGATEPVDVVAIATDVLTLYRVPDRSVRYSLHTDCESCMAASRSSELREVLVNLLENARAAVGDAGLVEVGVRQDGGDVVVEVRDDGEGIPEEQLPRIFEPHFSTRSSGTGLGLAIVRRLVESWGGSVGAESERGAGTVVWLRLPRITEDRGGEEGPRE